MGMMGTADPWQLEFETVEERCGYLLTSGLWTDCTLVVGPKTNQAVIPAHKLILAMASPVFEEMFFGGASEDSSSDEPVITIPDFQPEAFRALLPYIYTGNINITSFDMALDLWNGAQKYMLPHLVKECISYILSVLSTKNVCRAYEISSTFEEKPLQDKCIEIITTNTKDVLNDSSFEEIDINTLITVLSFDHLNVDSELELFHAVDRYAKAEQKRALISSEDVSESTQSSSAMEVDSKIPAEAGTSKSADDENLKKEKPTIRQALQKIRFLTLTPQQFADGPGRSDLLTKEDSLAILMNIASDSAAMPMPTGFSASRERRQQLYIQ